MHFCESYATKLVAIKYCNLSFTILFDRIGYFGNHRLVNVLPVIIPAALFAAFCFMPESPRYLCAIGRDDDAKLTIEKFKIIDGTVEYDMRMWCNTPKPAALSTPFRTDIGLRDLTPVFGIIVFEQLIGAVSIIFYMQKILNLTSK